MAVNTIASPAQGDTAAVMQAIGRVTHATRGINYLGLPAISVPALTTVLPE